MSGKDSTWLSSPAVVTLSCFAVLVTPRTIWKSQQRLQHCVHLLFGPSPSKRDRSPAWLPLGRGDTQGITLSRRVQARTCAGVCAYMLVLMVSLSMQVCACTYLSVHGYMSGYMQAFFCNGVHGVLMQWCEHTHGQVGGCAQV